MTEQVEVPISKAVVITSENSADFYAQKLGLPKDEPEVKEEVKAEEKKEEKVEEKEEEDEKKPKIAKRFSELTNQRKAAEARALEAEAKIAAAEKRAVEAELKLNPPKPDAKPDPTTYTDNIKYAEDLATWAAKEERKKMQVEERESREKEQHEKVVKTWLERTNKVKAELEDYDDKVGSSTVVISNQVRDAILESEVGPRILYHFAEHPEDAEKLSSLSVARALAEIGKLEDRLVKPKEEKKEVKAEAEISKAPEPIAPLNGGKGGAEVPINRAGEFTGTYTQWKELRRAGKIH